MSYHRLSKPRVDYTGLVSGKLTVVAWLGTHTTKCGKRCSLWRCKCSCGGYKDAYSADLRSRRVGSCGCLRYPSGKEHPNWTGVGNLSGSTWKSIQNGLRRGRGRTLDLAVSKEQIWQLFQSQGGQCALTGLPLTLIKGGTASLDRIDSSKGYTIDNIQWVHKDINLMKNHFTQDYFVAMCKAVVTKAG